MDEEIFDSLKRGLTEAVELKGKQMTNTIDKIEAALQPFATICQKHEDHYRKRGGNPDSFPDSHPSFNVKDTELTLGDWRRLREALIELEAVKGRFVLVPKPEPVLGLADGLAFRKEINEFARNRCDKFFGMNEDRPARHDVALYEAAEKYQAILIAAYEGERG